MTAYLPISAVAEALSVDERRVRQWIKSGELPACNCGSTGSGKKPRWRISQNDLDAFLQRRSATPAVKAVRRRRRVDASIIEFF